ncbi:concanavalin A-like lectin/glucanase domain-containing protein [Gongronella butleri]|nr:concanavalin A-like lectin/glucanase domain-containing protein [Gongronella butleri]
MVDYYVVVIIGIAVLLLLAAATYLVPKYIFGKNEQLRQVSQETAVELNLLQRFHSEKELRLVQDWQERHDPATDIAIADQPGTPGTDWAFVEAAPEYTTSAMHSLTHLQMSTHPSLRPTPVMITNGNTVVFPPGPRACCVTSNLVLPTNRSILYWEALVVSMTDLLAFGLVTRPYPHWRLPGWHKHSVAYHLNGRLYTSDPLNCDRYGPVIRQGDVVGIGYMTRTGTVFFTKNGRYLGKALTEFSFPVYPCIGSVGAAKIEVNFGLQDFQFDKANEWRAGLSCVEDDTRLPPPTYGAHVRDSLLEETQIQDQLAQMRALDEEHRAERDDGSSSLPPLRVAATYASSISSTRLPTPTDPLLPPSSSSRSASPSPPSEQVPPSDFTSTLPQYSPPSPSAAASSEHGPPLASPDSPSRPSSILDPPLHDVESASFTAPPSHPPPSTVPSSHSTDATSTTPSPLA